MPSLDCFIAAGGVMFSILCGIAAFIGWVIIGAWGMEKLFSSGDSRLSKLYNKHEELFIIPLLMAPILLVMWIGIAMDMCK